MSYFGDQFSIPILDKDNFSMASDDEVEQYFVELYWDTEITEDE